MNPLLDFSGLPRFDAVRPEHVTPAVTQLLAENRALIDRLVADPEPPTWDGFVAPLEDANERLARAWGIVGHLHGVMDIPEWREAYNASLPEVTSYYSDLGQNLALFRRVKALRESDEFATLVPARRRVIDNEIRDFRLGGAELDAAVKPRFKEIQEELAALAAKFSENVLDATNAHAEWIEDEALLAGIPEDVRSAARAAAERDGRPGAGPPQAEGRPPGGQRSAEAHPPGWKFTLHAPSLQPVLQYADHRELRARMYRAYVTRASEFGKPEWDNSDNILRILRLRAEEARLLGYASFAEVSLVPKMAESPQQVLAFLRELATKARPFAEADMAELRAFAADELGLERLESWDIAWASEKLRLRRYAFSEQEVKQYLPEPRVLAGLFRVIETLYGVRIAPDEAPTWHEDVRFYRIDDAAGRLVGQFYLDLYARDTKRGGAWMDEAVTRRRVADGIQAPVAYLTCNFSAPVGGKPPCFTHDEVITLFHECGHGLHHLLTRVEDLAVSGIHGVEWDAVELPSQFMENFCWEWDVLRHMSGHVDTGETLPRELFDKMLAAKNFQSGMQTARQLEFALFDLLLHCDFDPDGPRTVLELLETVRDEVAVVRPPQWNRFSHSFSHIFAGGYGAGYYSYKWAEVLSADAYDLFEDKGRRSGDVLDPATGARFRDEILAVGGSRPALESFKAFRGREPTVDALLRHNGMVAA